MVDKHSFLWSDRKNLLVHFIQLGLTAGAIALTVPRLFMKNSPLSRAVFMSLSMGIKSIFFIMYQILTAHVARFQRWRSRKANAILNILEVPFWLVVVIIGVQANNRFCSGAACTLSWLTIIVAGALTCVNIVVAYASWVAYRFYRKGGPGAVEEHRFQTESDSFSRLKP